ncbi:MAG: ABC transporter permease, partial [Eubacteriales bacterium]|nr:ABC transporter permease [Eubacteriales bacterium]
LPIGVLIIQSFNAGKSRAKWEGFSFRWYGELIKDRAIMEALYVTLSVAIIAAIVATVLGTLAAIGIFAMKKRPQAVMMTLTNIPMTMPDIVIGISLMLLFLFAKVERSYLTMLFAHITFNTPYVILSVMPKIKSMNKFSYEAALDLGASPFYALNHVIIPMIKQGIITGFLLAFTLSLDDFVVSYFTSSPLVKNLSTLIYSKTRIGIEPTLNALSAIMFITILVLMLLINKRNSKNETNY